MTTKITDLYSKNPDFLSPLGFHLIIDQLPGVTYNCQTMVLPGVTLNSVYANNPLRAIPLPGTKVQFEPVVATFRVDEDLRNWEAVFNWIIENGFAEDTEQYRLRLGVHPSISLEFGGSGKIRDYNSNIVSDITIITDTAEGRPNRSITLRDAFPTSLTPLQFSGLASTSL